ncbi:hypothetical protein ZIOFF_029859 [Zingiber officinale]|uniref:Uncharacterized protein n=1 Tax=Zingiber officinale TaxID=94328 RepID=A0A8J5LEQ3_ZINOF|nr:hypothetical protein ZIOFF_029859 [Zingiber officinale]
MKLPAVVGSWYFSKRLGNGLQVSAAVLGHCYVRGQLLDCAAEEKLFDVAVAKPVGNPILLNQSVLGEETPAAAPAADFDERKERGQAAHDGQSVACQLLGGGHGGQYLVLLLPVREAVDAGLLVSGGRAEPVLELVHLLRELVQMVSVDGIQRAVELRHLLLADLHGALYRHRPDRVGVVECFADLVDNDGYSSTDEVKVPLYAYAYALLENYWYITSPHLFSGDAEKVKVPLYGCDCYAYALLAWDFVDLVIESGLKHYDVLSLVPVIEDAGGSITDWKGLDVQWDATLISHPASFNVIVAGDSNIRKQALDELQWK